MCVSNDRGQVVFVDLKMRRRGVALGSFFCAGLVLICGGNVYTRIRWWFHIIVIGGE